MSTLKASKGSNASSVKASSNPKFYFTYQAVQTFCVKNVSSMISSRKEVASGPFFCQQDPDPPIFNMLMDFGDNKEGFLGVFVKSDSKLVRIGRVKITLKDDEGLLADLKSSDEEELTGPGQYTGVAEVYELNKLSITKDTAWRFICILTYRHGSDQDGPSTEPPNVHLKLQDDLLKLLKEAPNSDIAFVVQGERIMAHKGILTARSDYFANMFRSDMKENASNEAEVPDVEPEVFKTMLEFLYSGLTPKNLRDVALDLLVIADKYCLADLKEISRKSVLDHINADNVVDVLLVADNLGEKSVMSRAKAAFRVYSASFDPSSDAMKKLQTNPLLLTELLLHYCRN